MTRRTAGASRPCAAATAAGFPGTPPPPERPARDRTRAEQESRRGRGRARDRLLEPLRALGVVDGGADLVAVGLEDRAVPGPERAGGQCTLDEHVGPVAVDVEEPHRLRAQKPLVRHEVLERDAAQQAQLGEPVDHPTLGRRVRVGRRPGEVTGLDQHLVLHVGDRVLLADDDAHQLGPRSLSMSRSVTRLASRSRSRKMTSPTLASPVPTSPMSLSSTPDTGMSASAERSPRSSPSAGV